MTFKEILGKYREVSFNHLDSGHRFERLMQRFLLTDPTYKDELEQVWLWDEFPYKDDLGSKDLGIDLVAKHKHGQFWAIQCKFYAETTTVDKKAVDSFISTANRGFQDENGEKRYFDFLLWISTSDKWGVNAQETLLNQRTPIGLLLQNALEESNVDWQKLEDGIHGDQAQKSKKSPREHQINAINNTNIHFQNNERGKLIMACGTGKTYTALQIAENETNHKGTILFLVPSIALLGQTLREWKSDSQNEFNAICICSDPEISKKRTKNEETNSFSVVDLAFPASTDVADILSQFQLIQRGGADGMTVVFSTYQSIDVISRAQKSLMENGFPEFDLIICDEAHRTTGVTLSGQDESAFTKVHDNEFIKSKKRLYMTATPRLFNDDSKSKAAQVDAVLCSMDDVKLYGEEIYRIGFGEAVSKGLLTDYKVLILTLNDGDIPPSIQKLISNGESEINTDDASKLIGCINALSKEVLGDNGLITETDPEPMRRAVAFCQNISTSKKIGEVFNSVSETYIESLPAEKRGQMVSLQSKHIDGTMSAPEKDRLLGWLKSEPAEKECRILTNVRVLSEGVDVPSLDAVLFLSARNSQVDVVQSVGRVMRKAPNKKYGYIVIPVVVPSNVEADKALDDNDRYKVVWTVLNALRAHDDRFNATVNKIELNKNKPDNILVGGTTTKFDDDGLPYSIDPNSNESQSSFDLGQQMRMQFEELQSVVFARMVEKVGDRRYWEQWAKNVGEIAERQVERLTRLIKDGDKHQQAFNDFIEGLRKNINPSISEQEGIEMLSQHIITKPVFDALFEGYSFVKNNPISISMQRMLDLLEEQSIDKDTETLEKFYESVKMRAAGIDNAEGKQRIIIELYDKFFKTAFPKMVEKLGIVYTPVECVDFIIHSVNDVLKREFGRGLTDENIHLLDPFTGTGTFITRLIQSGLIDLKDLERKYKHEIHANEIVLLAYYIATINIENAYHDATPDPDDGIGKENYTPFDGIVLTDTFQLGETENSEKLFSEMFPQNSKRVEKQRNAPLRVIFGNPPYSVGQKSANDNAQNQSYPKLDGRISKTYVANSITSMNKANYDAYIKAFRWASDRLDKNGGIVCFISNGGWLDGNTAAGFRKCLEHEFSSIYIFNLRGNANSQGEMRRKESGNVFGSGSKTPVAITLLVKNPEVTKEKGTIQYHDIGDYLDRDQKLKIIKNFKTFANEQMALTTLQPNEHGDWLNQRNDSYYNYFALADKSGVEKSIFNINSNGVVTGRDAWVYNSSKTILENNLIRMIDFYNSQREDYKNRLKLDSKIKAKDFISKDETKIKWVENLIKAFEKNTNVEFTNSDIAIANYRPYFKQRYYYNKQLNWSRYLQPQIFPSSHLINKIICVSGIGANKGFSVLMSENVPNYHFLDTMQTFPLYYYEENKATQKGLFETDDTSAGSASGNYVRRDGVSDYMLEKAKQQYNATNISKEDIFYYVYGFLHSPEYREMFANDLKKMLPRLPLVDDVKDFWSFSKAGRELAELHLNYETVPPFEGVNVVGEESNFFKVEKMRFPKKDQKDTIHYNSAITISNIPLDAYEYVVNGKSAIEWIMERYQITTHKESQITNDPNDWADEVGNPRYILDLLLSIITVSMKTREIVGKLPKVKFE